MVQSPPKPPIFYRNREAPVAEPPPPDSPPDQNELLVIEESNLDIEPAGRNGSSFNRHAKYPITAAIRATASPRRLKQLADACWEDAINGNGRERAVAREFLRDTWEGKAKTRIEVDMVSFEDSAFGAAMTEMRAEMVAAGLIPAYVQPALPPPTDAGPPTDVDAPTQADGRD